MLDINFIKENKGKVEEALKNKQVNEQVVVDDLIKKYDRYVGKLQEVETHRALRNKLSEDISKVSEKEKQKLIEEATKVKSDLQDLEKELSEMEAAWKLDLEKIPNVYAEDTPVGRDAGSNKVLSEWGEVPDFNFTPKDHVELGKLLDVIDMDTAAKVSGSRFYYLKNEAVLLETAVILLVLNNLMNKDFIGKLAKKVGNNFDTPFIPVLPPVFTKAEVMGRMARLNPIDERYYFEKDDLVLVGSAEHSLGPMHMDENLDLKKLPLRYVGLSVSFRRESGSYGQDVRGIFRVHQFDKLEMESFSTVEDGIKEQDLIVAIQEELVRQLGIPYRLVQISTGDMGKPDFKQIDIECWMPSKEDYKETHTSDYMTDYQSRRLNTTYTDEKGKRQFVYMNDATAIAIPRLLIAILENFQQEDGSVIVPEVLRPYTGFDKILPKNI